MKEINGIVYAENPASPLEVTAVKALSDQMLLLTFSTGEKRLYDATQLLRFPAFERLNDEAVFSHPVLEDGVVTWDYGEIDIAPETMYANSYPYNEQDILTAS